MKTKRPDWDSYFITIAYNVSTRSTCLSRQVGAVAVNPVTKHILATGYNGAPRGLVHCLDVGCIRQKLNISSGRDKDICMAVHAEQNLLASAALDGISLYNSHVYVTTKPCITCLKLLVNAGIKRIVYVEDYRVPEFYDMIVKESGIILEQYEVEQDE